MQRRRCLVGTICQYWDAIPGSDISVITPKQSLVVFLLFTFLLEMVDDLTLQQSNLLEVPETESFDPLKMNGSPDSTTNKNNDVLISFERSPRQRRQRSPTHTALEADNLMTISPNANLLIEAGISLEPSPVKESISKENPKRHPAIARQTNSGQMKENDPNRKLLGLKLSKKSTTTSFINETHEYDQAMAGKTRIKNVLVNSQS